MAVLAGLGGGHLNDLAGSPFQQHEAVLAQGGALHGVGGGRPGITCLEVQVRVGHVCCLQARTEAFTPANTENTPSTWERLKLSAAWT